MQSNRSAADKNDKKKNTKLFFFVSQCVMITRCFRLSLCLLIKKLLKFNSERVHISRESMTSTWSQFHFQVQKYSIPLALPVLLSDAHHLEIQLFHRHRLGGVVCAYLGTMYHLVNQARCQESLDVFDGPVHSNIWIIQSWKEKSDEKMFWLISMTDKLQSNYTYAK